MPFDRRSLRRAVQGVAVGLVSALLVFLFWHAGWLDRWEARTWDLRAQWLAKKGAATGEIILILVDQGSLDWGKEVNGLSWPWPRELYAALIDHCRRAGAKAVALDILFTEPSAYGVGDDEILASAIREMGNVSGALFLGHETGEVRSWPDAVPDPGFHIRRLADWMASTPAPELIFPRATFSVPEISTALSSLGNVQGKPDPDGIYRSILPFGIFDGKHIPSLAIGAYLAANPGVKAEIEHGRLKLGDLSVPIGGGGEAILRYRGPLNVYEVFSAASVLQSEIRIREGGILSPEDRAAFKDKYVLIGFSAPGLFDLRPSPVASVYPGVAIQATVLDNLLSADFIRNSPGWADLTLLFLLPLLCSLLMMLFTGTGMISGVSLLFILLPPFLGIMAYLQGIWLPIVLFEAALLLTIFGTLAVKYATEGRQKRFIKSAFGQYLSPAVIDRLIHDPDQLQLGGERRNLSIFFSDLQGFTTISEGLTPEQLTDLLNRYLTAMTDIITQEGGTVDKYEGDAIIAFWNAPLDLPEHALHCVRAALRCQAKLSQLRPEFQKEFGHELHMRIGINTGDASVGNFGSLTKFDYTIIGDAVNLAARLEGANKEFGTYTMISWTTRDSLGDAFAFRPLGMIAVKGREDRPVTIYEPMYKKEFDVRKELFETFGAGLSAFWAGEFQKAESLFSEIAKFDPAAGAYGEKCRQLLSHPPESWPEKWDGVWVMTSK